jgi:hypothetical protein
VCSETGGRFRNLPPVSEHRKRLSLLVKLSVMRCENISEADLMVQSILKNKQHKIGSVYIT